MSSKDLNLKVKHIFQFTVTALTANTATVFGVGNITPVDVSATVTAAQIVANIQYNNQFLITPFVDANVGAQGSGDYVIGAIVPQTSFAIKSLNPTETSTLAVSMTVYECIF